MEFKKGQEVASIVEYGNNNSLKFIESVDNITKKGYARVSGESYLPCGNKAYKINHNGFCNQSSYITTDEEIIRQVKEERCQERHYEKQLNLISDYFCTCNFDDKCRFYKSCDKRKVSKEQAQKIIEILGIDEEE